MGVEEHTALHPLAVAERVRDALVGVSTHPVKPRLDVPAVAVGVGAELEHHGEVAKGFIVVAEGKGGRVGLLVAGRKYEVRLEGDGLVVGRPETAAERLEEVVDGIGVAALVVAGEVERAAVFRRLDAEGLVAVVAGERAADVDGVPPLQGRRRDREARARHLVEVVDEFLDGELRPGAGVLGDDDRGLGAAALGEDKGRGGGKGRRGRHGESRRKREEGCSTVQNCLFSCRSWSPVSSRPLATIGRQL